MIELPIVRPPDVARHPDAAENGDGAADRTGPDHTGRAIAGAAEFIARVQHNVALQVVRAKGFAPVAAIPKGNALVARRGLGESKLRLAPASQHLPAGRERGNEIVTLFERPHAIGIGGIAPVLFQIPDHGGLTGGGEQKQGGEADPGFPGAVLQWCLHSGGMVMDAGRVAYPAKWRPMLFAGTAGARRRAGGRRSVQL